MADGIVGTVDISITAPELPSPLIRRPHLVETIEKMLQSSVDVVCVEASAGHGKTALLLEFATYGRGTSFMTFLGSASRASHDPALVRHDLADQLHWFLQSKRWPPDQDLTDADLRSLWHRCASRFRNANEPAYVVVDGLHHLAARDARGERDAILDLLPLGVSPFKVLLSGTADEILSNRIRKMRVKPFTISTFAPRETDEYLEDLLTDKEARQALHTALGGVPYLLASVRRQIAYGKAVNYQIDATSVADIGSILDQEWHSQIPHDDEVLKSLMATLVAYGRPLDTDALATHSVLSPADVHRLLQEIPFMTYSRKSAGWQFRSDQLRELARTRLRTEVDEAMGKIVSRLLLNPDSDESISELPGYLHQLGNSDVLMEWLTERRMASILVKQRSVASLDPMLKGAVNICHTRRSHDALTLYSLSRSILKALAQATGMEKEIRARAALGDQEGALAVANNAPLLTQRVRLLAVAVNALSDVPGFQSEPILNEIRVTLAGIDREALADDEAVDIATDLYPVDAGLALALLKDSVGEQLEAASFEVAMASISLSSLFSRRSAEGELGGGREDGGPKNVLLDKKLRQLYSASMVFFQEKTAQDVLNAAASVDDVGERLFILRKWASQNPKQDDAIEVVESAIQDAIATPSFTPNATFYREIATPLPYFDDAARRRELVSILDGQAAVIQRQGPTVDYVRLQLCLARCDPDRSVARLEETYFSIMDLDDLETKTACLAWMVGELSTLQDSSRKASLGEMREFLDSEFENALAIVLADGAEQLGALEGALQALAERMPREAIGVAERLNTVDRRDAGLVHIAFCMLGAPAQRLDVDVLNELLDQIEEGPALDTVVELAVDRVADEIDDGNCEANAWGALLLRVGRCTSAAGRARSLGEILVSLATHDTQLVSREEVERRLIEEFRRIEGPKEKYDVACELVAMLHSACPAVVRLAFDYLETPGQTMRYSDGIRRATHLTMELLAKAAFALGRRKYLCEEDVRRVCEAFEKLDDPVARMQLFAMLGLYLWREGLDSHFEEVAIRWLWPGLEELLGSRDRSACFAAWVIAYPVAWLWDKERCKEAVASFPALVRRDCDHVLSFCLLNKQPAGEPFDESGALKSHCSFSDVRRLLELCDETSDDRLMYAVFRRIAGEATDKRERTKLTRDHKAEIARRMVDIAERRLPMPVRIRHKGYQILCRAQAMRITRARVREWTGLVDEAVELPNEADRVHVLAHLASCLPTNQRQRVDRILDEAQAGAANLVTLVDQYDRYCSIATVASERGGMRASRAIRSAFGVVRRSRASERENYERRLVDLAYRIDPELPAQLATLYDDDPAREEYRERTRRRVSRHQLKKDLGSRSGVDLSDLAQASDLAWACWNALGSLNSGRMVPAGISTFRDVVRYASDYPLTTSFPMYTWAFANVMERYRTAREGERYARDIFEAVIGSANMFLSVIERGQGIGGAPDWRYEEPSDGQLVVKEGQAAQAVDFIRDWIRRHATDYIWIVDPYFGPDELWLVVDALEIKPDLEVKILTGRTVSDDEPGGIRGAYLARWRHLCESPPPVMEVVAVCTADSKKAPFHDRHLLSRGAGLRLGSSVNSIGHRVTELSVVGADATANLARTDSEYLSRQARAFDGERLNYQIFAV